MVTTKNTSGHAQDHSSYDATGGVAKTLFQHRGLVGLRGDFRVLI
jgi:hypothetical protein